MILHVSLPLYFTGNYNSQRKHSCLHASSCHSHDYCWRSRLHDDFTNFFFTLSIPFKLRRRSFPQHRPSNREVLLQTKILQILGFTFASSTVSCYRVNSHSKIGIQAPCCTQCGRFTGYFCISYIHRPHRVIDWFTIPRGLLSLPCSSSTWRKRETPKRSQKSDTKETESRLVRQRDKSYSIHEREGRESALYMIN